MDKGGGGVTISELVNELELARERRNGEIVWFTTPEAKIAVNIPQQ